MDKAGTKENLNESVVNVNTDGLKATTQANAGEPMRLAVEKERLSKSNRKLKAGAALAASATLVSSLLLTACGEDDDCIPTTAPNTANSFVLPQPPSSSQFTSGQPAPGQTYCQSRRTGGYFWYVGGYSSGRVYGSGGAST